MVTIIGHILALFFGKIMCIQSISPPMSRKPLFNVAERNRVESVLKDRLAYMLIATESYAADLLSIYDRGS